MKEIYLPWELSLISPTEVCFQSGFLIDMLCKRSQFHNFIFVGVEFILFPTSKAVKSQTTQDDGSHNLQSRTVKIHDHLLKYARTRHPTLTANWVQRYFLVVLHSNKLRLMEIIFYKFNFATAIINAYA